MLTISKYHHNCLTVTESTKVYSISAAAITRAGTGRADVGCRHQRVGVQCWGRRWGGGPEVAASEDTERTKNKVQSYFSVRAEVGVC